MWCVMCMWCGVFVLFFYVCVFYVIHQVCVTFCVVCVVLCMACVWCVCECGVYIYGVL